MPIDDILKHIKYSKCSQGHKGATVTFSFSYKRTRRLDITVGIDRPSRCYIDGDEISDPLYRDLLKEILLPDCYQRLTWEESFDILDKDLLPMEYTK